MKYYLSNESFRRKVNRLVSYEPSVKSESKQNTFIKEFSVVVVLIFNFRPILIFWVGIGSLSVYYIVRITF